VLRSRRFFLALLFVSNTRILYNCEFWDFDFQAAAAVFIGAKKRLHVSVPSIETPSTRQATMTILFDWNRTAAATAFDKQLLIAQGAASGENVAARLVGTQVEEKIKNKKTKTKAASSSSSSSAGAPSTSASSTSATATAFFSRSPRPACPPQQFRFRPRKGGRINRNTITGLDQFFKILNFIHFSEDLPLSKKVFVDNKILLPR
jgi:hypothetical protein